jgi:hypothetical protein
VYRRILGIVYDNEKENWRILTNKEIYTILKTYHNRQYSYIDYVGLDMYREYKKI